MAGAVVPPVRPHFGLVRKRRKRPRVPGPEVEPVGIDHPPAIKARNGVLPLGKARRCRPPPAEMGAQKLPLRQRIRCAGGKIRLGVLGTFGVGEDVGLVRPLVHRRAAELGEPDRLRLRHPRRRRRGPHVADAVVVRLAPPAAEVLGAPNPGLVIGAVGDRRPHIRHPIGIGRVVPAKTFTPGDVGLEVVAVIRPAPRSGIEVVGAVAPIRQRQVVVDAERIDRRRRPERIEVEELVARRIGRLVAGKFRPVGAIGQLGAGAQRRSHIRRQRRQLRYGGGSRSPHPATSSARAVPSRAGTHRRRRPRPPARHSGAACAGSSTQLGRCN